MKPMKIGVTGTRHGPTKHQLSQIMEIMNDIQDHALERGWIQIEFHHGDCKGVDAIAAALALHVGWKIVSHPPVKDEMRAFTEFNHEARDPKGYLERDRNIVDEVDFLMVVPYESEWQPKGGTWYTHDYAKKTGTPYKVLWPS